MMVVVICTLSIVLGLRTHSIMVLIGLIMALVLYYLFFRPSLRIVIVYLLSIVSGWGSVMLYDALSHSDTLLVSDTTVFTVIDQQRDNRYLITTSEHQQVLLYSTALLEPGDSITSTRKYIPRDFSSQWCRGRCPREQEQSVQEDVFDYNAWLYMQGVAGSLYDDNPYKIRREILDTRTSPRISLRQSIKQKLTQALGTDTIGALGLGMLIGDRSLFHKTDYQSFIDSGLVHLVAVSGGNIAIMVALASLLLFWVPFTLRTVVLMIVVVGYAYLVGSDSSVIRATIMALLTLAALLPGRQISIWRLLAYAWLGMLMWNPYYLFYDLGFLLSFGALLGIIWSEKYVFQRIRRIFIPEDLLTDSTKRKNKLWTRGWWRDQSLMILRILILPSIGALVGVLPILIRSTGQINLLSPVFNILILPWVPLLTFGLVVTSMIGASVLDPILSWGLGLIVQASNTGAEYGLHLSMDHLGSGVLGIVLVSYRCRWIYHETKVKV